MPYSPSQRVTKPLLPNTISQVCAAMTSGTIKVVMGNSAIKALPLNE